MTYFFVVFGYSLLAWLLAQPFYLMYRSRKRRKSWRHFLEATGFEVAHEPNVLRLFQQGRYPALILEGDVDGMSIAIRDGRKSFNYSWTWAQFTVELSSHLPEGFRASEVGAWSISATRNVGNPASGDPDFDAKVALRGAHPALVAYLTAQRRSVLRHIIADGGEIRDGQLRFLHKGVVFNGPRLVATVRHIVSLAKPLKLTGEGIVQGLVENSLSDDLPSIRLRNIEALLLHYGDSAEAADTMGSLLDDADSAVRLQAALHLGRGAEAPLIEIATSGKNDEARTKAAAVLWKCDPDIVADTVLTLLDEPSLSVRLAAIYSAGKMRLKPAKQKLLTAYKDAFIGEQGALATALVELSTVGDKQVEALLLDSLTEGAQGPPTPFIRGLGEIGTVEAVETLLRALAGAFGGDRQDRRIAKEAIMVIQSRALGAEAGQVSLVEVDALEGALTLDGLDE